MVLVLVSFFFQAEDGIRDLVRSRGLGDVYKRQGHGDEDTLLHAAADFVGIAAGDAPGIGHSHAVQELSLIHI